MLGGDVERVVVWLQLSMLADFSEVQCIKVTKEKDNMQRVEIAIKGDEPGVSCSPLFLYRHLLFTFQILFFIYKVHAKSCQPLECFLFL